MPTLVDILFLCLLFEPERILFNPIFCSFNFFSSIIHVIVFIVFTFFVFHRAIRENKLVYNKKQLQLFVVFLFLSTIYCMYFYFKGISFFDLGLKVKLFLWCFYFIPLKQYLAIVDHRRMFKMIGIVLSILIIIALPWSLGIHGTYLSSSTDLINKNTFPYNPNWFACLLCFMFLYFVKEVKRDKTRFFLWTLLIIVLFLLQTRFSFCVACFILPFFAFKKLYYYIPLITIISLVGFCILQNSGIKNNKIVCFFKNGNFLKQFTSNYIKKTSAGDFLAKKFNLQQFKSQADSKLKESHNFYITLLRDYNFFENCVFLTTFLMFFNLSFSMLFLLYCFTITAPLYFFIAFILLIKPRKI